jgi:hypothetical protein
MGCEVAFNPKTIIRIAKIANSVPLKGLPEYQANIETDTTGRHNRIAINLFEGFQWNKREMISP